MATRGVVLFLIFTRLVTPPMAHCHSHEHADHDDCGTIDHTHGDPHDHCPHVHVQHLFSWSPPHDHHQTDDLDDDDADALISNDSGNSDAVELPDDVFIGEQPAGATSTVAMTLEFPEFANPVEVFSARQDEFHDRGPPPDTHRGEPAPISYRTLRLLI